MRSIILSLFTLFFFPLAAQDPVQIALDHLGLEIYRPNMHLFASHPMPGEPGKSVVVVPESLHGWGGDFDLHTHLVLVDEEKGEVIARSRESLTNIGEDYGPLRITKVTVDTIPYPISKSRTAFGVRVDYYVNSRYDPYSYSTLSLVEEEGGFLNMVLAEDTIDYHWAELDISGLGKFDKYKKEISVGKQQVNGYFPLIEKVTREVGKDYLDDENEYQEDKKVTTSTNVLKFDGRRYRRD